MKALSIHKLRKEYPGGIVAVKDITLNIEQGDFFALSGPNGAGKSTIIGISTSLIKKTEGNVHIFGHNLDTEPELAKSHIGLVPQEINFSIFEKVIDVLVHQAGYYGVPEKKARQKAEYYLRRLALWDYRNKLCMSLSGGMKRRLMLARAVMHEPDLLILDEPTAGVDIEVRREIWDFLKEINNKGTTIILTTHYLEEAETLCKNIAIIDHGELIQHSTIEALLEQSPLETFVFDLKKPLSAIPNNPFSLHALDNNHLEANITYTQTLNDLFKFFEHYGIEVHSMRNKHNRLEALFLQLVSSHKSVP